MYWRLVELAVQGMDEDAFEDLVFALVRIEHENARQMGRPDAGRDVVLDLPDGTELVWQAKHHQSIKWSDCEESLQRAVDLRRPREMTFVFPVKMTEGKEPGLADIRARHPQVKICNPWTLPDLRTRLMKADDVRLDHIDRAIGVDEIRIRKMMETAAKRDQGFAEQTAAAMAGPLAALGRADEFEAAEALAQARDFRGASRAFEALAAEISDRMPRVANALLLQAARLAADAPERERAGELYLQASRGAAERSDDLAEFAAFRATWLLPEDQRWRCFAALARATWPERRAEAVPVLCASFERALEASDHAATLEWALAACDALAVDDDWDEARGIAERAVAVLGPVRSAGPRLALELELLTARGETGVETDDQWRQLALAPVGRTPDGGPLIRARWGMALARSGRGDLAAERFAEAAERWRAAGDAEDELGEAVFSEDVVAQTLGAGRLLDPAGRIAVAELRGRVETPATRAERLVNQGLRAWLAGNGWQAEARLVSAWAVHRRAGHLAGTLRVAETLHDLFKAGKEWPKALSWAIRSGRQLAAGDAAAAVGWAETALQQRERAPTWERGPMWDAIAGAGENASDEEIAALTPRLLAAAADHETIENHTVQAPAAARRALAAFLCRVPAEHLEEAAGQVVQETLYSPFPSPWTLQGLLFATDAGVYDASEAIALRFGYTDQAHLTGFDIAVDIVKASPSAQGKAVELVPAQYPALLLCAWADLPDEYPTVADHAADVVARSISSELGPHEILRLDDRGRLARWAPAEDQRTIARRLLDDLVSPNEIGVHRYEAACGLASLGERVDSAHASELLDELLAKQDLLGLPSTKEQWSSRPNPLFSRHRLQMPADHDLVVGKALGAVVALALRANRTDEALDAIRSGIADDTGDVRAAAVRLAAPHTVVDVRPLIDDAAPAVRVAVLRTLDARDALEPDEPGLIAAVQPDQEFAVRSAALTAAREHPRQHPLVGDTMRRDQHVYLRAVAHRLTPG